MLAFLQRYWYVVAAAIGAITWVSHSLRKVRASTEATPRSRPPRGSVGPVPFRGADFVANAAIMYRFYSRMGGTMIACIVVGLGFGAIPGLSYATRVAAGGTAGVGALVSFLILALREGALLRRLGLYCPQCGRPLGGGGRYRDTAALVRETGQCRCGAWIIDPADLPLGQGPDPRSRSLTSGRS